MSVRKFFYILIILLLSLKARLNGTGRADIIIENSGTENENPEGDDICHP
jgi:hypothetical protein